MLASVCLFTGQRVRKHVFGRGRSLMIHSRVFRLENQQTQATSSTRRSGTVDLIKRLDNERTLVFALIQREFISVESSNSSGLVFSRSVCGVVRTRTHYGNKSGCTTSLRDDCISNDCIIGSSICFATLPPSAMLE